MLLESHPKVTEIPGDRAEPVVVQLKWKKTSIHSCSVFSKVSWFQSFSVSWDNWSCAAIQMFTSPSSSAHIITPIDSTCSHFPSFWLPDSATVAILPGESLEIPATRSTLMCHYIHFWLYCNLYKETQTQSRTTTTDGLSHSQMQPQKVPSVCFSLTHKHTHGHIYTNT